MSSLSFDVEHLRTEHSAVISYFYCSISVGPVILCATRIVHFRLSVVGVQRSYLDICG
jgi:hypothetical protein